jgi:shikimate 5-dehydrogenase
LKFLLKKESFSNSLNLLKRLNCHGLSITTPFKKTILENYNQSFGYTVANTLDVKSKKLINTDILALEEALETTSSKSTILLIGDGCCATGFSHYLKKQGRFFDQWSRKQKIRLKEFYHIIINATSSAKPLEELPKTDLLINLYGFEPYPWIEQKSLEMGTRVITAKQFFYLQAMYQFKFWFKDFIRISYEDFFSLVKVPERSVEFVQIKRCK